MELNDYCSMTNEQEERFKKYESLLIEWNKKINLTAITEHDEVILKHFVKLLIKKSHKMVLFWW